MRRGAGPMTINTKFSIKQKGYRRSYAAPDKMARRSDGNPKIRVSPLLYPILCIQGIRVHDIITAKNAVIIV
jgi:hypothetical protein